MHKKKISAMVAMITIGCALLISSCGGSEEGTTTKTTTTTIEPTTTTSTGATSTTTSSSSSSTTTTTHPTTTTTHPATSTTTTTTTTTTTHPTTTTTVPTTTTTTTTTLPGFQGGTFDFQVLGFGQSPANCLIAQSLLDIVAALLNGTVIPVDLPAPDQYPTYITLPLPAPIGTIQVYANLESGQLVFADTTMNGIDLGAAGLGNVPGFNCIVGGTAYGGTTQLSHDNAQVNINIKNMSATQSSSGSATCTLSPTPDCILTITLAGTIE